MPTSSSSDAALRFRRTERQLVVVVIDLARFVNSVRHMNAVAVAALVDQYYREVGGAISDGGGRVVKCSGDAVLAVFPPDRAADAVAVAQAMRDVVRRLRDHHDVDVEIGVNLHLSTVAEGAFGPDEHYDIIGPGVNHAFTMGAGPGIRISEPVYRKLPSGARGAWEKRQPPATYWEVAR